jgi:hypothetical protein
MIANKEPQVVLMANKEFTPYGLQIVHAVAGDHANAKHSGSEFRGLWNQQCVSRVPKKKQCVSPAHQPSNAASAADLLYKQLAYRTTQLVEFKEGNRAAEVQDHDMFLSNI